MRLRLVRVVAAAALVGSMPFTALIAQSPGAAKPLARFEVASVKLHDSDDRREMMVAQNGRFLALNVTLRHVLRTAFQLQDDQIVGGPNWFDTDRFDIEARAAWAGAPPIELLEMLQSLLAERFMLTTHREMRELSVFALERARRDGVLGPSMQPTKCPDPVVDLARPKPCVNISFGFGSLSMRGMPLPQIIQYLTPNVNRVVIDRSGLDGRYDLELKWLPEQPASAAGAPNPTTANQDRPSIFTAVQEQLGLKLEPTRGTVEVLVIDSIARPTPN